MSFWEDLQAWTQAQYDALILANLKRKTKWTTEDINRLLRDRVARRLKAMPGRAIGAEFRRTAGRIAPPIPLEALPMETGWLTFEDRGGGTLPYVYTYAPTGLTKYTIVPSGITLDGYDSYPSQYPTRTVYTPPVSTDNLCRHRPERYSGLMRLAVQSLVGANRVVEELLGYPTYSPIPAANNLLPQRLGLIRSPQGVYWIVFYFVDIAGKYIRCRRLAIPPAAAAAAALAQAWSGQMSAADANYLEAFVLSQLQYDTSASYVELVPRTNTEFQKMYATGFDPMPWGWCWRYQKRGAPDEHLCGGVWTTKRRDAASSGGGTVYSYAFRRMTLDITFTAGVPSATFTVEELGSAYFNSDRGPHRVYLTDATKVTEYFTPSTNFPAVTVDTAPAPVLSWYGSDGDMQELEAYRRGTEMVDNTNIDDPTCGPGVAYSGFSIISNDQFCGLQWNGVDLIDPDAYRGINSSTSLTTMTVDQGADGATFTEQNLTPTGCNGSLPVGQYDWTELTGTRESSAEAQTIATVSAMAALIISDIPGVAWVANLGRPAGTDDTYAASGSGTIAEIGRAYTPTAGGATTDLYFSIVATCEAGTWTNGAVAEVPGQCICIADIGMNVADQDAVDAITAWLGAKTGSWDRNLMSPGFTLASPATTLTYMPALGGYNAINEMYQDGLADRFDARAYTFLGRLIGGA